MIVVSGILQATLQLQDGTTIVYKTEGELQGYSLSDIYDILDTLEITHKAKVLDWYIIDDE